jgi:hypothetical protein
MAFALLFEPVEDVVVDAKMDRGLTRWHDYTGAFPKIITHSGSFGRVGTGSARPTGEFFLDTVK